MPRDGADLNSDDYVAQVLAKEARDNSLKYSAQGLGAYMPKRPASGAPKPNMRFLRHIIRETDNHNASLKRKEERESRERMRQLRDNASSSHSRDSRRHRDSEADRGGRDERKHKHRSHRRHRSRSASEDRERSRRHRHSRHSHDEDSRRHSRRDRRSERDRKRDRHSRSRSRSPKSERHDNRRDRHRLSPYDLTSPGRRSRSPEPNKKYKDSNRYRSHRHRSSRHTRRKESPTDPHSGPDSDPLEDIVGPLPQNEDSGAPAPIRSRGRGAYKPNLSNIDAHFAPDYDPNLDVSLEDDDHTSTRPTRRRVPGLMTDDEDWELALEAFRDRARWRKKGEERLREAGFNDSVVERWKNNAAFAGGDDSEGRLEDVKWSRRGEGREWDRGKFVDDEGRIDVRANW